MDVDANFVDDNQLEGAMLRGANYCMVQISMQDVLALEKIQSCQVRLVFWCVIVLRLV